MHQETIISLATPVFFGLIAIEWLVARIRGRNAYRFNDALNSIGLGIISQITAVFTRLLRIGLYAWTLQHVALWTLRADQWWVWALGLTLYDFCYYWLHRMGHEVNVLWAAHVVHHQSENYNLTTALRQTSSGVFLGWLFYLPMALLGIPVAVFAVVALIDLLYQFWIHTEQIGRLGWFDRVFASPSNHRVHHAVNERYLDRNYGGILILWDRLFHTFEAEDAAEPCVYGTRAPLRSWNPLWANAEVYWAIGQDAWRAQRWRDKIAIWFRRPGWRPPDVARRFPKADFEIRRSLFDPVIGRSVRVYTSLQFVSLLAMAVHFLAMQRTAPIAEVVAYCVYLVLSLTTLGALMEGPQHSRAVFLEFVRLALSAAGVAWASRWFGIAPLQAPWVGALLLFFLGSAAFLWFTYSRAATTPPQVAPSR